MRPAFLLGCLISLAILLAACRVHQDSGPAVPAGYEAVPFTDLVFEELDPAAQAGPGIPACRLADLPPFHWKEVDTGLVDIRTPEAYAIQTESLYQEGYLGYQQARVENPDRYQGVPEMSYEAFLAACNVFPDVDFEQYTVLGAEATGTGCSVAFTKHVYRDDPGKRVLYEVTVSEEGACETVSRDRNLILVPRIPAEYSVAFVVSTQP